ncbi:DUF2155 domain-containing protein [Nereida sp. MMG025]|uniref:DUF2155 domain-containing protein n=1 Tax=Nereida sp. MMG025 TaxID=2909981 RepID=UPI001F35928B|nr:DUF2155 domain-containing protein [Nereida sp. MMG025]MCF6443722.1 DUF2155 domain-containing protein [Nereida sp. MMG025]
MIRALTACVLGLAIAAPAVAQQTRNAPQGIIRVLDKTTGTVQDLELEIFETRTVGRLSVAMQECRYPRSNPSGDAYILLTVTAQGSETPVFEGWMIASAPALNAMEHPRYDVWALRCKT